MTGSRTGNLLTFKCHGWTSQDDGLRLEQFPENIAKILNVRETN